MSSAPSGTPSGASSELPVSVAGDETPAPPPPPAPMPATYPPYPAYVSVPAPPSVAETIITGRGLRMQHKSMPRQPVRPLPRPARPRGPKATDVKMSRRAMRLHARCLRRHGAVLTDRLERIAKPLRRTIIYLWREHADTLPPETIARLRAMLDADEPFKPDQAYEYFINVRKTRKMAKKLRVNQIKKDVQSICDDKRFVWARNATVAFARGIQQRLSRPGRYALADGMLRLSNIILDEICGYVKMRTPSRRCTHPRAKFMMEMSDKVAVWIDEILSESDDRMLMMDFDEDDEVEKSYADKPPPSEPSLDMTGSTPAVTPGESGAVTPRDSPSVTPGDTPAVTPGDSPASTPGITPAVTPGITPAVTPGITPTVTPEITPAVTPGVTPTVTPGITPAVTPGITPAVTPGITPAVTPGTTPASTPAVTALTTPGASRPETPGTSSVGLTKNLLMTADGFADDFLNMMGGDFGPPSTTKKPNYQGNEFNDSLETVLKTEVKNRPEPTAPT